MKRVATIAQIERAVAWFVCNKSGTDEYDIVYRAVSDEGKYWIFYLIVHSDLSVHEDTIGEFVTSIQPPNITGSPLVRSGRYDDDIWLYHVRLFFHAIDELSANAGGLGERLEVLHQKTIVQPADQHPWKTCPISSEDDKCAGSV